MEHSTTWGNRALRGTVAAGFWLAVWQGASAVVGVDLLLPGPAAVAGALGELAATWDFWRAAGLTLLEILAGFAVGVGAGSLLALLTWAVPAADLLLSPLLRLVRSTPVASFIILALLWLSRRAVPVFVAALMVTPIVWSSTKTALGETDAALLEMARAYRFPRLKTFRLVYLPQALPQWTAACTTAIGLAWKSGIAAEVIAQPDPGIGTGLYRAKLYLNTDHLFAWTATVIVLSFLLERLFVSLLHRFSARRRAGSRPPHRDGKEAHP